MRRNAVVAGQFYPARASEIEAFIKSELSETGLREYRGVSFPMQAGPSPAESLSEPWHL